LNQEAAFGLVIPYVKGAVVKLKGSIYDAGSQHRLYHESLENFWKQFRRNGQRYGDLPTCAEYHEAVIRALEHARISPREAEAYAELAKANREAYGLTDFSLVPRIPDPIPGF
jgi:hypothetical protein